MMILFKERRMPRTANRIGVALSTIILLTTSVVSGLAASQAASASEPVNAGWANTGPMAEARPTGATATTLKDGRILVAGGQTGMAAEDQPMPLSSVEIYDPQAGSWSAAADMSIPRTGHGAALLPSGKVLVVGGGTRDCSCRSWTVLPTAEIYDPGTNTWTPAPNMGWARWFTAAVALADGRALFVGGYSDDPTSKTTAELFTESTGVWSGGNLISHPYAGHTATLMKDGRVFVLGGPGNSESSTSDVFDPITNSWIAGPGPLNVITSTGTGGTTATLLKDGRLLVVGADISTNAALSKFYDPATNAYTETPPTLSVHSGHTATLLPNGNVLVVGGFVNAQTELFDPVAGQWTTAGNMLGTRGGHIAALLPDNSVLVATGEGRDDNTGGSTLGYLRTAERSASLDTTGPPPDQPRKGPIYLALGDSIPSGHGLRDGYYDAGGPHPNGASCNRSTLAYPFLIATKLKEQSLIESFERRTDHLACVGQKSDYIRGEAESAAKTIRLLASSPARYTDAYVTVDAGINDFDFGSENTASHLACDSPAEFQTWISSVIDTIATNLYGRLLLFDPRDPDFVNRLLKFGLSTRVRDSSSIIPRLLDAGKTRVVLQGLYNPVQRNLSHPLVVYALGVSAVRCPVAPTASGTKKFLARREIIVTRIVSGLSQLNSMFQSVADLANGHPRVRRDLAGDRVRFVSLSIFDGHVQCSGETSYVQPYNLSGLFPSDGDDCVHPSPMGANVIAAALESALMAP